MTSNTTSATGPHDREAAPTSLYRYYDAGGILLYVGVTSRGTARNREHWSTKQWWPYVASQEVDHHANRNDALDHERDLIVTYHPPFNKQHNPEYERLQIIYRAYVDAYQPSNETFVDQYRRLNHRVSLRPVPERGAPPDNVWFSTLPEQFELARTMTLASGKQPMVRDMTDGGRNRGMVMEVIQGRGMISLLRVDMRVVAWPPVVSNAVLKVVDLKRKVSRVTSIEILQPKDQAT